MAYIDDISNNIIYPFAELYKFEDNTGVYKITSYYKDILFNNELYERAIVKRGSIKKSVKLEESSVQITMFISNTMLEFVEGTVYNLKLTITRYFFDTGSYKVLFKGVLSNVSIDNDFITLNFVNFLNIKNLSPLRFRYQRICNNILYDSKCRISKTLNSYLINYSDITKVNDVCYQINNLSNYPHIKNGFVAVNLYKRFITNVDYENNLVYIQYPFEFDASQYNWVVYKGCDLTYDTCKNVYNNTDNFNGFIYLKTVNPVLYGVK